MTLDEAIFGIQPNVPVLHQVVTAQLAAARAGTQSTKTRAEVSGGGRKPFKQKGHRPGPAGVERAPQFTGGGVAFGPKPRSYRQRTPRKMIQLALRSALSDRAADGKVVVIDSWPWSTPSTRKPGLRSLPSVSMAGCWWCWSEPTKTPTSAFGISRSTGHLAGELNAYDILCNDWIVFTRQTLPGSSIFEAGSGPEPAAPADATPVAEVAEVEAGAPASEAGEPVGETGAPVAAPEGRRRR